MPPVATALSAQDSSRLVDFARACKAAARGVLLYPDGHPAISATLARIVDLTSDRLMSAPLTLTVLPDGLLVDGHAPARPDPAVLELAALLHAHLIGQLTVHPGGGVAAWRDFLMLLGRSPEAIRAEGGITRVWETLGSRHVHLREIDYAEALRERTDGETADWERLVAFCLQGDALELSEELIRSLLEAAAHLDHLEELIATLEQAADGHGPATRSAALLRLLRGIVDAVSKTNSDQLELTLRNMAVAMGMLSPDTILELLRPRSNASTQPSEADRDSQLLRAVVSRMNDDTIASFVARGVTSDNAAIDRVAQAFQALVPDSTQQPRLLALAREDVVASPLGATHGFEATWDRLAEQLLRSYNDEPFVSAEYGRELSNARGRAIEIEAISDDSADRINAWLSTVATTALRTLDLTVVTDLLRIEQDEARWGELMIPIVRLLEDLLLVGDFAAAGELVSQLTRETRRDGIPGRRAHAMSAIEALANGPAVNHLTAHLDTLDETEFDAVRALCLELGEPIVAPIVRTLTTEDRPRTRERWTSILLAFGPAARRIVEQLKTSQDAGMRRTAIYLIRQFGGSDSLPDLTELLDDGEPQMQREALRAILNVGTDAAYRLFTRALTEASPRSRDALMQALCGVRDERAAPLFAYILRHVDHRGPFAPAFHRAVQSLGVLRAAAGIEPLTEVLHRGEWWAPRRTAALRSVAAAALARIGTPEAIAALEHAAGSGSRGVRAAARAHLETARAGLSVREGRA